MLAFAPLALGCDSPVTNVVLDNEYPTASAFIIYEAAWQAVSFQDPIPPGTSSTQSTVPASTNEGYVVLAPGWDLTSATPPTSFIVMQSQSGFSVHLNETLHIPVDDTAFVGNCGAGSFLTQEQADLITQLVFPGDFASVRYTASTCTTSQVRDAGVD